MAKLTGKAKEAFLRRMAKGRRDAAKKRKSKSKTKRKSIPKSEQNRLRRARNRGVSAIDRKQMDALLLAIKDPNIKEIVIKK